MQDKTQRAKENISETRIGTSDGNKPQIKKEEKKEQSKVSQLQKTVVQCYNCNKVGHRASNCSKPARFPGSCYSCGSLDHQKSSWPRNRPPQASNIDRSTLLVSTNQPSPYQVPIFVECNNFDEIYVLARLHTGSPVGLIRNSVLPENSYRPATVNNYFGINGSKLNTLGIFDGIKRLGIVIGDFFPLENVQTNAVLIFSVGRLLASRACNYGGSTWGYLESPGNQQTISTNRIFSILCTSCCSRRLGITIGTD
ncbi:Zinc knuckle [Popillia japonica]|uniref:Zinc knuckle n=1 Tax=Popillia japonica TaxID=7064 RepID=A0AAW1LA81_POPJA